MQFPKFSASPPNIFLHYFSYITVNLGGFGGAFKEKERRKYNIVDQINILFSYPLKGEKTLFQACTTNTHILSLRTHPEAIEPIKYFHSFAASGSQVLN